MVNKFIRRLLAGGMAAVLACSLPGIPARAKENCREVLAYDLKEQEEKILNSEEASSYKTGAVTFPLSSVSVNMGDELVYHIFRQGNTGTEQKVTLAALDLTAGYGEDYEIFADGKPAEGRANRILDGTGAVYDVYPGTNVLKDASGEPGKDEESSDGQMNRDEIQKSASAVFDMVFEEGEQEKEIRIRAKEPEQALGNKELQLMVLACGDGLEEGGITGTAVTLIETRETEEAQISIVEDSTETADGYVTVLVERTGNTAGYSSYTLESEDGTAVNGEDYILKTSQLTFSPGVSRQRIHIPLVASGDTKEKEFTLKAAQSQEEIRFKTEDAAVFPSSRELVDIPMTEFEKGGTTVGGFTFSDKDNGERYEFSFDTGIGDGSNRSASVGTRNTYDFTGIKEIRLSASYLVGTVVGDHLDVYASDTDYCENKTALGQIVSNRYGDRIDTVSLTGQGIHNVPVSRTGEYHVYITAEQHNGLGHIGYNLYNQNFDGKKGHVALVKQEYSLKILSPSAITEGSVTSVPAGDMRLTLASDTSVSGSTIDKAYRDETYTVSFNLMDDAYHYAGYQLLDGNNKVFYSENTESPTFTLSSELIQRYSSRITGHTFTIRPVFEKESAEVEVLRQDFAAMGMDTVNVEINMENCRAIYKDNGIEIATVTWNSTHYGMGDTLAFHVAENPSYMGDYHFSAYQVHSGASKDSFQSNPLYYTDPQWSTVISAGYYAVTPMVSNRNARLLLNVEGASHGKFIGKPENFTGDSCTVEEFDGKYECNDVVAFAAEPAEGYRARWSYRDVASGETKIYYGSRFYYRVQIPVLLTDNHVSLTFETCGDRQEYSVVADVYMQGGDVLHQPEADSGIYTPFQGAVVSLEGTEKPTLEDGSTEVFTVSALPDETYTALVTANNRAYIQEVAISGSKGTSLRQKMKLSYYYEGPRVTGIRYFDYEGTVQNGDVIYLENETDGVILGATVTTAGQEVSDVLFQLKSADGTRKGEPVTGEHNGSEYLWSASLGMLAEQGDQIWVELVNRVCDDEGNVISQTSYGEVNTGYSVVIAEFDDASYIPDTGDVECNVPVLGNMYFLFGVGGIKPILTTSKSGNITYMTIGLNFGAARNFMKKDSRMQLTGWDTYAGLWKNGMQAMSPKAAGDQKIAARQALKKSSIAVNLSVSLQLALYQAEVEKQSRLLCVGAWMSAGFNTSYTFNVPFTIEGFPMFASLTVTGGFSDMFQVMPATAEGYVDVRNMHDPTQSGYKAGNDFNAAFSIAVALGAGVNGLLSVSGGGTGKMTFDWLDFSYGNGKLSLSVDARLEALLIGRTFSYKVADLTMFDTNPYKQAAEAENRQMMDTGLDELKVRLPGDYNQSVNTGNAGNGNALIADAYEFSRPKLYPMEGGKYLLFTTVDGSQVSALTDAAGKAVLSYAVYDSGTGTFESGADGKIFFGLEPEARIGDSMNFHPCVTAVGGGKYLILWNSVLFGGKKELSLKDMRTVIKGAVYDSTKERTDPSCLVYKSFVNEDEEQNLVAAVVTDVVYDEKEEEAVMLYRNLRIEGLPEDAVLADFSRCGSSLACASLPVDDASLADPDTAFTEHVIIEESGEGKTLKTADLDMAYGQPVCAYHVSEGEQSGILNDGEDGSRNHIYLASLKHTGTKGYALEVRKEASEAPDQYQGMPKLSEGLLMWKQEGRMAAADVKAVLEGISVDKETMRSAYDGAGIASLGNTYGGNFENFCLIQGGDGKDYALWTEVTGSGTNVLMSVLEDAGDGVCTWGKGSVVFETEGGRYIQAVSPQVDADGKLQAVYRETVVDSEAPDDGSSNICLRQEGLGAKQSAVDYAKLAVNQGEPGAGSNTADKSLLENMELKVSNLYPQPGETVTITGKVKNDGVQRLKGGEIRLLADGKDTGQESARGKVPDLAAGEEAEVVFVYTVPEDFSGKTTLSLHTSGGQSVSQSIYSGASLDIRSIHYEPLNYAEDTAGVRYRVTANIENSGNVPSADTTLVLSHIELGENDSVNDTALGTCEIPALEPRETYQVSFEILVGAEFFQGGEYRTASVGAAIYEDYGTGSQNMKCAMLDYLPVEEIPEAAELKGQGKRVGVGQKKNLRVRTEPLKAKEYTELIYESMDETIAVVDQNGILTGVKEGTCKITVRTADGLSLLLDVQVVKDMVPDDEAGGGQTGDTGDGSHTDGTGTEGKEPKGWQKVRTGDGLEGWYLWLALFAAGAGIAGYVVWYRRRKK